MAMFVAARAVHLVSRLPGEIAATGSANSVWNAKESKQSKQKQQVQLYASGHHSIN